jgi:hypothetical protein
MPTGIYYNPVRGGWVQRTPPQGNPQPGYGIGQFQVTLPRGYDSGVTDGIRGTYYRGIITGV